MDARPWTAAALIGALWGALEMSLGTALHLSRIPICGLVMTGVGLVCLVTLRRLRGRFGVCVLAGIVAAFLKIFTLGGFRIGPVIGILFEALVLEFCFFIFRNRRFSAVLGGAIVSGFTAIQMVLTVWIVSGREALDAGIEILLKSLQVFGIQGLAPYTALAAVFAANAFIGILVGWWAWDIASRVNERLAR